MTKAGIRLTPKEPDFEPGSRGFTYKLDGNGEPTTEGVEQIDFLDRSATGKKLSDLVDRLESPTVIALDGSWGSGKSLFLKLWCGAHTIENEKAADVIYFDAFEHDFLDDPLIALTGAIYKQLTTDDKQTPKEKAERAKKFRNVAWALGKASVKVGVNVATFGAMEQLSDLGDTIVETLGGETSTFVESLGKSEDANKFWEIETAKITAMKGFRQTLREMTLDDEGKPTKKLVIIIDELDRCRPDYALSMLEIMKHFFAVDGVHFVLGVNLKELENSVRARYGADINAARYLQKFVHIKMDLPVNSREYLPNGAIHQKRSPAEKYCNYLEEVLGLQDVVWQYITELVANMPDSNKPTMRDLERVASKIPFYTHRKIMGDAEWISIAFLMLLEVVQPEDFKTTMTGEADFDYIARFYGLQRQYYKNLCPEQTRSHVLYGILKKTQKDQPVISDETKLMMNDMDFKLELDEDRKNWFLNIYENYLSTFRPLS